MGYPSCTNLSKELASCLCQHNGTFFWKGRSAPQNVDLLWCLSKIESRQMGVITQSLGEKEIPPWQCSEFSEFFTKVLQKLHPPPHPGGCPPAPWHCTVTLHLQCWYPIWAKFHVLATPLLTELLILWPGPSAPASAWETALTVMAITDWRLVSTSTAL